MLGRPGKGFSVAEICQELEVSFKTVYRDLTILENTGIELIRSDTGRYRVAKGLNMHRQLHFSPEESEVLLRSVSALPESPVRQFLEMKLAAMTDPSLRLSLMISQKTGAFLSGLHQAIQEKRQVLLLNYRSAKGKSERDRLVEPIQISPNAQAIWAYELREKKCKLFKLNRIENISLQLAKWQHEAQHQEVKFDLFGLPLRTPQHVKLKMGILAASILQEEYPVASSMILPIDNYSYLLETEVDGYAAISRFVLGLMDDVTIIGPSEWKTWVEQTLSKSKLLEE